jgi:hypothetical protein
MHTKTEGRRPLGRFKHIWEDNFRMVLRKMRWEVVDWIHLPQGGDQWQALVNTVMIPPVPKNWGCFLAS